METHNVKWSVALSNGETIHEGKGEYIRIAGEPSPWERLLLYIGKNDVRITSMSLYTDKGHRWNLQSGGNKPRFRDFASEIQPFVFRFFRKTGGDVSSGVVTNVQTFAIIEAIYTNGKTTQLWVDDDTLVCWVK